MTDQPVDVLIIGAGASGAAMAWSLADTRMRIVCLEQGEMMNPANYPSTGRDWEARSQSDFAISPNQRQLPGDYPIVEDDSPIKVANFNGVGGGTVLYAGHFPRFHPSDFRVKSLDGVADDWPLDYNDLAPHYAENDRMMGVAGLNGDPAYPSDNAQRMPPLPLGKSGDILAKGFNKLNWHWWPSDTAIATQAYDGRDKCINLGACLGGCAQGAKASTDITYWPHAMRAGVELRTRCRVREITVNDEGMATGVIFYDEDGFEQFLGAHVVVMACNGVGTPRILLNSKSAAHPDGLANSSGLVGKNLMFHPYASIMGVFDEPLDGYRGPHKIFRSQEFYETDKARDFVRGYTFEIHRGQGPVSTAMTGLMRGKIPWGAGHHDAFRKLFNRIAGMVAICEDLPEEHNTVTLDPMQTDSDGIPAPRISYTLSDNSRKMMDHAIDKGSEVLRAAGAVDIMTQAPISYGGWHLMGTARMGSDPERSVVNEWGRSHDVRNLFVIDGSIFVTSAGVNPTRTIQALALYVADQMKQRLANLFD
ncbi:MAG: GMC family oxidoreductase [Rhodospirillaceae bacterium]|jgi:choline dehydrogenase-like flavoprotein|nr:GMC family oxidoreductase [Rhodospirillaceae bacterium]MBT5193765.1 GMC family oxidoreductase [Rhodospirillaceae bacterium]MBT6426759.1 GMC family oxidoreductase [Rhodospirillaceae bacterium]